MSTTFLKLSQIVSTYPYQPPSYEDLMDTYMQYLILLKEHKQYKESEVYKAVKSLFWELSMRIATENQFIDPR